MDEETEIISADPLTSRGKKRVTVEPYEMKGSEDEPRMLFDQVEGEGASHHMFYHRCTQPRSPTHDQQ